MDAQKQGISAVSAQWVTQPHLPRHPVVLAAVSASAKQTAAALQQRGIAVLPVAPSGLFASPVAAHADLQCFMTGMDKGFCADAALQKQAAEIGVHLSRINVRDFSTYPEDCSLNALWLGDCLFANPNCLCPELKNWAEAKHLKLVLVHQGYVKCSAAVITEQAILTADAGLAAAVKKAGMEALQLQPGFIRLAGYSYGFIGGACAKLSAETLAFCGDWKTHPQALEIEKFLMRHAVQAVSLFSGPLQDVGGILPLKEGL